jgi:hypothetical protein
MSTFSSVLGASATACLLLAVGRPGAAQSSLATRERLQAELARLERAGNGQEASLIRLRLGLGDFQSGDRILLRVEGEAQLSDTFTVGPGRELTLPQIGAVPLEGLLRAELRSRMATTLARYLKDPVVTVRPLVTVLIEGEVARPGFYALAPEQPLSEVITAAGGLTQRAKTTGMRVQRESVTIWGGGQLQQAMGRGYSLDQLNLRAGDRILVPARGDAERTMRILAVLISIPLAAFTISRIAH